MVDSDQLVNNTQEQLKNYYRNLCIQENAFINDVGDRNYNYDQRRIVVMDMFLITGMGVPEMDEIEHEVNQYTWTQKMNNKNQIVYEKVKENINELTRMF